jgi:hypothetical protein
MHQLELTHRQREDTSPFQVRLTEPCSCIHCTWDDDAEDEVCTTMPTCQYCKGRGITLTYAGQELLRFLADYAATGHGYTSRDAALTAAHFRATPNE